MPCCGQLEYTRLSVPRLLRHSRPPFEVLFVDAGSLDGTQDYLAGVAAAASVPVKILRGEREEDFPKLVAEAIQLANSPFVAWVNNDVLVVEFWLQQLVALLTSNEVIGGVGPMANLAPEQQRVATAPYRLGRPGPYRGGPGACEEPLNTEAVDVFAREFREANQKQWGEIERVGGFCWLGRREVVTRVSMLDKGGSDTVFDAGQFSSQVRRSGFHLACCRDLYVHHFGSSLIES
jgi:GT2 family glycosyltransferase